MNKISKTINYGRRNFLINYSGLTTALIYSPSLIAKVDDQYQNRLYTPTQIVKLNETYFIVDCWHHRVLYTRDIKNPITSWQVLDDNLAGPHSIASNGSLYVTEDTGRNSIKIYRELSNQQFSLVQTIPNIGVRPHRTLYDSNNKQFLIVGANDQSIYIFAEKQKSLDIVFHSVIRQLNGQYCRSITIQDNFLYFVGVKDILMFELKRYALGRMVQKIVLNEKYHGSNDLFFTGKNQGFLTSTPQRLYSFKSFKELENGTAVDQSTLFKGTPYYIESFDGKLFIPEITEYSAISYFQQNNNKLENKKLLFDFGAPTNVSIARKSKLPL